MPKGRIGLSLEQDVLDILAKHGRSEIILKKADKIDARRTRGEIIEYAVRLTGALSEDVLEILQLYPSWLPPGGQGPIQREIIEIALREWATRSNGTAVDHTTERTDNSLSPEAKQARDEKKAERASRKAELSDTINKTLPLKREQVVSIPKPGKK